MAPRARDSTMRIMGWMQPLTERVLFWVGLSLAMRDIRSGRLVATFRRWLRAEADAEIQEVSDFLATKRSR